ncbi:MAG: hypothetical protein KJZ69_18660 [Phycisphaerales bacterium]|nr:hypothetical protein [Phycisphaerales bacterium]
MSRQINKSECNRWNLRTRRAASRRHLFLACFLAGVVFTAILATKAAKAAPPEPSDSAFAYQGLLLRQSIPVNDVVDLQFTLWNKSVEGEQTGSPQIIWQQRVTDGRFSAILDFGPDAITSGGRWIEIAVRGSGDPGFTTLLPRQRIMAAPLALYSLNVPRNSDDVDSPVADGSQKPISGPTPLDGQGAPLDGGGAVPGTGSDIRPPATVLDANRLGPWKSLEQPDRGSQDALSDGEWPSGGGPDNCDWQLNCPNIFFIGGNVGIGTTGPAWPLHVYSRDSQFSGYFSNDAANGRGLYAGSSGAGSTIGLWADTFSTSGDGVLGRAMSLTGTVHGVRGVSQSTSGRGVYGLANSTTGLTYGGIFQSDSVDGRGLFGNATSSTGATYGGVFQSSSNSGRGLLGQAISTTGSTIGIWADSRSPDGTAAYVRNQATSGNSYALRAITSSPSGYAIYSTGGRNYFQGNVGIGTTSPAYPLSVNGLIQTLSGGYRFPDGTTQATSFNGTSAGGDLAGAYPNPGIRSGAITNSHLAPNSVATGAIQDRAVTGPKIANYPANGLLFFAGDGTWKTPQSGPPSGPAGGDLTGTYPNPLIASSAVTNSKIADRAVTGSKISGYPSDGTKFLAGDGTWKIPGGGPPSGNAGGDLTGTYPNPQIASLAVTSSKMADSAVSTTKIADRAVTGPKVAGYPSDGTKFFAGDGTWKTPGGGPPSGNAGGDLSGTYPNPDIRSGAVTNSKLADGAISTSKIVDRAVTGPKISGYPSDGSKYLAGDGQWKTITVTETDPTWNGSATPTSPIDRTGSVRIEGSGSLHALSSASTPLYGGSTGQSGIVHGVYGETWSTSGRALYGISNASTGTTYGVIGADRSSSGTAVYGSSSATSGSPRAVFGRVESGSGYAGYFEGGRNYFQGNVGIGTSSPSRSLHVLTSSGQSIYAEGASNASAVIEARAPGEFSKAILGISTNTTLGYGVYGETRAQNGQGQGVRGHASATSGGAIGVWGSTASSSGYAGYFSGRVHVNGTLSKSGGTFKIDHPLDPANKYLYHSFVESPDMMNIYNGNIITDADGRAVIAMPEYFMALNTDFQYQLTVIGQFAHAIIESELNADGRFSVRTDKPNVKVSWQITGVRQDAYARAHPVQVEVEKPTDERGRFLHPELYGRSPECGLHYLSEGTSGGSQ